MKAMNNNVLSFNNGQLVKGITNELVYTSVEEKLSSRYIGKRVDLETAMAVIGNQKVVPGFSKHYTQLDTITFLKKLLVAGIEFTWDIDMLEAPCFKDVPSDMRDFDEEEYKFSGKHRIVVYPKVEGVLAEGLDEKLAFAFYIYNSSDRTMRFALFAGWLVWMCMNGCFSGEALKTADGEDAFIRQRHIGKTRQELEEEADKIVAAVKNYIDNKGYESLLSKLDLLTKTHDSEDKSMEFEIAKAAMLLRISQQPWYTKKFLQEGNRVFISDDNVKSFMNEVTNTARRGQLGTDLHDIMQRYQGAIGANPQADARESHIPTRLEFQKVLVDKVTGKTEFKDSKLTKLQMRDHNAMQTVNTDLTTLVLEIAEAA